ncbi:hypothetical protein KQI84_08080 [bacterium]|nr:hypothetical protein [bacterium]
MNNAVERWAPPQLLRVRMKRPGRRQLGCWLPLILIWLPALLLALALVPLVLLIALICLPAGRESARKVITIGPQLWQLAAAARGTRAEIHDGKEGFAFAID